MVKAESPGIFPSRPQPPTPFPHQHRPQPRKKREVPFFFFNNPPGVRHYGVCTLTHMFMHAISSHPTNLCHDYGYFQLKIGETEA